MQDFRYRAINNWIWLQNGNFLQGVMIMLLHGQVTADAVCRILELRAVLTRHKTILFITLPFFNLNICVNYLFSLLLYEMARHDCDTLQPFAPSDTHMIKFYMHKFNYWYLHLSEKRQCSCVPLLFSPSYFITFKGLRKGISS